MPHRRKGGRQQFAPQLKYEPDQSYLYLQLVDDDEDLAVSLDSLTILFSLQFCSIKSVRVRFLRSSHQSNDSKRVFKISRQLGLSYEIVNREETPAELLACRLPAWYLPSQRTCIAGDHKIVSVKIDQLNLVRSVLCCQILLQTWLCL